MLNIIIIDSRFNDMPHNAAHTHTHTRKEKLDIFIHIYIYDIYIIKKIKDDRENENDAQRPQNDYGNSQRKTGWEIVKEKERQRERDWESDE